MIRLSLLALVVTALMVYAWKDWYKSLCGLIVLTSILNHPDVPRSMLGVPGLSAFNLLLLNNLAAWSYSRSQERLRFNLPVHVALLLSAYLLVLVVAFARMLPDRSGIEDIATRDLWIDDLMNPMKWVVPGLLLFDGARTPERLRWGLASTLFTYLVLALQVIKAMPLGAIGGASQLQHLGAKLVEEYTGYSRVNMSMMLAGAAWAMMAARLLVRTWWWRPLVLTAFVITTYGQALTGGRTGYATWGVLAVVLGVLKWRRFLLLAPLIVVVVIRLMPAIAERALTGIKGDEEDSVVREEGINEAEVTSGRSDVWPKVSEKIRESPVYGYGMKAMRRTGLAQETHFPHPHNAYLEILLDGGWISLIPVALFYCVVVFRAMRLFLRPRSSLEEASSGAALALTLALLVAGVGSQHFYPQMGSLGMWAAIGLMLRASVDRPPERRHRVLRNPGASKIIGTKVASASV